MLLFVHVSVVIFEEIFAWVGAKCYPASQPYSTRNAVFPVNQSAISAKAPFVQSFSSNATTNHKLAYRHVPALVAGCMFRSRALIGPLRLWRLLLLASCFVVAFV